MFDVKYPMIHGPEVFDVATNSVSHSRSGAPRARSLLRRADALLMDTIGAQDASEQFLGCYVAALRGAAAALAFVDDGSVRRPRSRSAWVLMARAAPDLAAWSEYFVSHSAMRVAVEAGASRVVTDEFADSFYRSVGKFLGVVEELVGSDPRLGFERTRSQPLSA